MEDNMALQSHRHLASFSISEAGVPVDRIRVLLGKRTLAETIRGCLAGGDGRGPRLAEIPEADLARVNYLRDVRRGVEDVWRAAAEESRHLPAPQVVERLDRAAAMAQTKIDSQSQQVSRSIFAER